MARPTSLSVDQLLSVFHLLSDEWLAMRHITPHLAAARPTIVRRLADAIRLGLLEAQGQGPARQYRLRQDPASDAARYLTAREPGPEPLIVSPPWSDASRDLLQYVRQPKALRTPVSYNAGLVENYQPNQTFLLPAGLRDKLRALGQATGERPAGTYVRDILGQLLIDLSWSSSKLEGNKYSRLETKQLIEAGQQAEGRSRLDAVMILNHKNAIEFLAEIAPHEEPYELVIANIQSLLMDGLMPNADVLGRIRERIVHIEGSVYIPLQSPLALRTLYKQVCSAAQATRDPLEAAFFLFTQLPYLQPFEDGDGPHFMQPAADAGELCATVIH
ncbi:MAG: filamentation induced by cAMP protein Fic 1 [Paucimonas sp.]|nr:filamentation induced by cAMP protein Fic 1 [Paucimonas sp.]